MWFGKEYKCYKGKDSEDCCQKRVDEAVLHRTTMIVLIISIALIILAFTVKTADDNVFVSQVSFASTVTSIVLSVIAIWMSITGERSTNEIKEKVRSSVDKLTETTKNSVNLSHGLEETLNNQNVKYDELIEKMGNVINNIEKVNESVGSMNDLLYEMGNSPKEENEYLEEKSLVKITKDTINSFGGPAADEGKALIKKGISFVYAKHQGKYKVRADELVKYLKSYNSERNAYLVTGMIYVFSQCGLFDNVDEKNLDI